MLGRDGASRVFVIWSRPKHKGYSMKDGENTLLQPVEELGLVTRRDVLTGAMAVSLSIAMRPVFAGETGAKPIPPPQPTSREELFRQFGSAPREYAPIDNWWWEA